MSNDIKLASDIKDANGNKLFARGMDGVLRFADNRQPIIYRGFCHQVQKQAIQYSADENSVDNSRSGNDNEIKKYLVLK